MRTLIASSTAFAIAGATGVQGASPMAGSPRDPTHTTPVEAALMAGEFAVHLRNGDVYSVDEVRGWLTETGWRFVAHTALTGPQSLVAAEAA